MSKILMELNKNISWVFMVTFHLLIKRGEYGRLRIERVEVSLSDNFEFLLELQ